jgi:hypothetical protein
MMKMKARTMMMKKKEITKKKARLSCPMVSYLRVSSE